MTQLAFAGMGMRLEEKIEKSIETLRLFAPKDGTKYWGAFSGGKDSCTIKKLAELAGVPVEWHYSVTTVDPPELVWFIKKHHKDVKFDRPVKPMWAMMRQKKMPPTRLSRWCCEIYKESRGEGRIIIGVRAQESPKRAARWKVVTPLRRGGKEQTMICPILQWTDEDVWAFHAEYDIPYCSLYDEGFKRLGCVMCPLGSKKEEERIRWPAIERLWKRGIDSCWEGKKERGELEETKHWGTKESMWAWWLNGVKGQSDECQGLGLFTDGDDD